MYLIIYLIGFIVSYVILKRLRGANEWLDILSTFFISCFWPIAVPLGLLIVLSEMSRNIKPPKWL